jgi:hypothetical protein
MAETASNKDSWGVRPTNTRLHGKPGSVNPLGYPPTQGRRKAQIDKISLRETGGGVCGHGKMMRSVQKSQLLIEQTEEFVSHLFDAGHLTEAKRLAVTLRVLLTPRPQRILLTIDLSEVSGVSDGGEFIRVRRRVLRPEDGSLPE